MTTRNFTAKTAALNIAVGMWLFGLQQLSTGRPLQGGIAVLIGVGVFAGYQWAEEHDHEESYERIVQEVGEDNLKALSEVGAERIRAFAEERRQDN